MEETSTVPTKDSKVATGAPEHVEVTQPKASSYERVSGDLERDGKKRGNLPQPEKRNDCLDALQFICCLPCIGVGACIIKCYGGMC
jgi:hypothetical protein